MEDCHSAWFREWQSHTIQQKREEEGYRAHRLWRGSRIKMPKHGILHDYDLMANKETSATNQTCAICGASPMQFQWSDYSGEAMCTKCGCCYQLKWGSDKQMAEGNYPYLNLKDKFLPVAKEYWNETHMFVCYGQMLGPSPGYNELIYWVEKHHPEFIEKEEE